MTDEHPTRDLPEAFSSSDPARDQAADRVGAGRVVEGEPAIQPDDNEDEQVDEASEESFPGSDATPFRGVPTD